MLERRRRFSNWFGTEEVPALRFEVKSAQPGEEITIRRTTKESFRGLELEIEEGMAEFEIHSLSVDGEPQLVAGGPIAAEHLHDNALHFPFTKDDGEMVMVVKNIAHSSSTFRAFVNGRLRHAEERMETLVP